MSPDLNHLITLFYQGFGPTCKKDHLAMALLQHSLYAPGLSLSLSLSLPFSPTPLSLPLSLSPSLSLVPLLAHLRIPAPSARGIAISHWVKVLGAENVIVMQTELLHLSDQNIRGEGKRENIREVVRQQLDHVHRSCTSPLG
jgi:hypothetical protein